MKAVLVISPERWTDHFVSKHHYAMTLARLGTRVLFLNPPDPSCKGIEVEAASGQPNLHIVNAPRVARGLRFYPDVLRRWRERRWLIALEHLSGVRIETIWLFENSRFFDLSFADERLKIYHQVDLNQDFHPAIAARTADICFCTTDYIAERLRSYNPRVHKIHHGLAEVSQPEPLSDQQASQFGGDKVHAVYIGNLDMAYLDVNLLVQAVQQLDAVQFHFVGGYSESGRLRSLLKNAVNVTWWGRVNFTLIPSILGRADVLLVAYQENRAMDQASPHKFLEYFDSGKTIVATYTDEYKDKRHLLEMADHQEAFFSILNNVVQNLEAYNSTENMNRRREFARAHTYDNQLNKIRGKLDQYGLSLPVPSTSAADQGLHGKCAATEHGPNLHKGQT